MGRVAIVRVVSAVVAILLTWFGFLGVCTAAARSTVAQANYAYESSRAVVAPATDNFDRAPPSTSARSILHIAAVWGGGGSTRLAADATPDPTTAFTIAGKLSQRAQTSPTTWSPTLLVDEGEFVFEGSRVAAKSADEFVNLASEARTTHILQADATGGGHLWPGGAGKSPFPQSWSGDKIMHEISDIATDPAAWRTAVPQGSRTVLTGTRDGVDIRVVVDTRTGDIVTGYPTNVPRNP